MEDRRSQHATTAPGDDPARCSVGKFIWSVLVFLKRHFSSSGEKVTGRRLWAVIIALMISVLSGGLDSQLFGTAIPKITSEFHSLGQAAWYQASYDLARLAFLPIYGRIYTLFALKITYCVSILIYVTGSIVCATSATSYALIIGRAIQGCAHAGTSLGGLMIICHVVSKQKMPLFLGIIISMASIAAAAGPPLGGLLAERSINWRMSFFLSIAMALIAGTLIAFIFPEPVKVTDNHSFTARVKSTDPLSCVLILGSVSALFVALQWGGTTHPWSNYRVWGSLIVFAVTAALFLYIQIKEKDRALMPIHILTERTVGFSCLFAILIIMSMSVLGYYMPFYFQAAQGLAPRQSDVHIMALTVPDAIVALASGAIVTFYGHYVPFMITSGAIVAAGCGLLSQIGDNTDLTRIIGFELIVAFGFGLGVQLPLSAVRNVLDEPDVAAGEAIVLFCVSLGSTLALPIAQTIFMNTLSRRLATGLPASNVAKILHMGASEVNSDHIKEDLLPFVAASYSKAVTTAFYISVAASGLAMIAAASIEWRKLEKENVETTEGVLSGRPINDH
ncbi:hypothetical protein diail_9213 [Diaporthe ilicicola]|nr:hypothetical protein diail_9213 [Diaporthe ilicicola]